MKIQHFMALVVLSLGFKARTLVPGVLTLACLLAAAPATAQVNYVVSGSTAYVAYSPNASGDVVIASTYNGYPVTSIGGYAFADRSLTSVTIPNSVTVIGGFAFTNCTSLTSVTIGNSVTNIGNGAFTRCISLTSVTIPNSVTSIGYAFSGCTSLTNLSVEAANPAYSSLDGVLFNKAQTTLIIFPPGRGGSYVIPDNVTSIGYYAFYFCTSLTSVTIPNSVTSIELRAFELCTSLTNVTIGNSVTSIGGSAFSLCTSLASVTIGNSVTTIGEAAFLLCTSLPSVTIPNSVTNIGRDAFTACYSLTNFTFLGNAPWLSGFDGRTFLNVGAGAKAYYYCDITGWGTNYGGLPTVMLCPPQIAPGSAGVKPGGFGFTLTRLTNQTIVVEASTNLLNWQPIWTNPPPGTSVDFVDPEWVNHSNRFYRARSD